MNLRWTSAAGITAAALLSLAPLANAATGHDGASSSSPQHALSDGSSSTHPSFLSARTTPYRVQPGNTLGQIATMFHTTWTALAQLNRLSNPNLIYVGQLLQVPGSANAHANPPVTAAAFTPAPSTAVASYRVQPGNTLSSIASLYHTTWQNLASLNHLSNPNALWVGEELKVQGHASVAPQAAPSRGSRTSSSVSLPMGQSREPLGQAIVSTAQRYLGVPYVWGGTSPAGFDCSGLVQYVLGQNGISIGRTSFAQYAEVTHISKWQLVPGDLVFFQTYQMGPSHVGIYIGADPALGYSQAFIDAPAPGQTVMVQNLDNPYYESHYYGAGVVRP